VVPAAAAVRRLPGGWLAGYLKLPVLVCKLHMILARIKTMAYIGNDDYSPIWLPESLPEEILTESCIELFHAGMDSGGLNPPPEPNFGFIVQDWFGPFLLSPPARFLQGHC
jgi:hypothetical protein